MTEKDDAVSDDAVRGELDRILASPHFDASERNRRFLAHVIGEALAGRGERIKAYAIATSVFGRDERFDPQLDSIVRIEAGRLRRSLERYYLTDGRHSHLRIEIPRGAYVPRFSPAKSPPEAAPAPRPGGRGPSILVMAFEEEGDQSRFPSFTRGFTRSLIVALSRFTALQVYGAEGAVKPPSGSWPPPGQEPEVDYFVAGQSRLGTDRFGIDVLLLDARTGRSVWAESFERRLAPEDLVTLRNEAANQVARALAEPHGAIVSDRVRDADGLPPERLDSYAAVLQFHAYWRSFDRDRIEEVRAGLAGALAAEPDYAEALACLSLVHSNAHRFSHHVGGGGQDPRRHAEELADRAVALAPNSAWTHYAQGLARWFVGNVDGALEALETGRALNPNDMAVLADLGQRYAMLARWDEALPLLEEAYAASPSLQGGYRIGLFLHRFAHGRYLEALREARVVAALPVLYGQVAVAAAAAELGLAAEAKAAVAAIRALDPAYGDRVAADLAGRNVAPALVERLVASLAKAGLPMRERLRAG